MENCTQKAKVLETVPSAIQGPDHVAQFVRSILTDNSREHFVALYLDGANESGCQLFHYLNWHGKHVRRPSTGSVPASHSYRSRLNCRRPQPSISTSPSQEDIKVTQRLKDAGEILAIKLLDHLIVTDTAHRSIINES